jgi:hypothetical protein
VALQKKKFGNKSLQREIQFGIALLILVGLLIVGIYIGINGANINFDLRQNAAGKTYFVENSATLQDAINKATESDAIFLRVGNYTTTNPDGFVIKDKKLQILGAGRDFVKVQATNNSYVFNVTNSNVKFDGIKITGANKDGVLIDNNGKHEVVFKNVGFENNSGSAINADAKVTVSTSVMTANGSGIVTTGDLFVDNTLIETSSTNGIEIAKDARNTSRVVNTIIQNNKGSGIAINGGNTHIIKNVTVYKNESGIVDTSSANTNISNTIVQGSKSAGISVKSSNASVTFTNSYGNGTDYTPSDLKSAEGNMSVDSQFTSDTDVHLSRTSSPVRGKGVTTEKNNDGTRIDLGAFGGNPNLSASNGAPTVTSTAPRYLHPGQQFNYTIKATDPDNDPLTYTVINSNAPKWITQNQNNFTGTPATSQVGFWAVVVVVSDQKGHNVVHPISINVIPSDRAIPQDTGATPAPTSQPAQNPVAQISFVNPKSGATVNKDANEIRWTVTNGVAVDKYVLKYSEDKENFKTITTLPGDATSYKWSDVEKVTPGKYILQLEATDKSTPPVTVKQLSEEFEVKSVPQANVQNIVITKNSPADNDNVTMRRPFIAVEYKPDADVDTSKTYLKVNDTNVEFKYTKNTIYYDPTADLQGTKARVEVKIVTKDGAEATKQWIFNLPIVANPQDTKVEIDTRSTVLGLPRTVGLIVLGVIILALLLLILYFVAKLLKTIRDERQGNLEAEFTEYYDGEVPAQKPNQNQQATNEPGPYPVLVIDQNGQQQPEQAHIHNEYTVEPGKSEYFIDPNQQQASQPQTADTTTQTVDQQYAYQPEQPAQYDVNQPAQTEQTAYQTDPNQPYQNVQQVAPETANAQYQYPQDQQPVAQQYEQNTQNQLQNEPQGPYPVMTIDQNDQQIAAQYPVEQYQQPMTNDVQSQSYDANAADNQSSQGNYTLTDQTQNAQASQPLQNDGTSQPVVAQDYSAVPASGNDPQSATNEYLTELKKKYGITDDDIQSYNAQMDTNGDGQPDPSRASSNPNKA